MEKIGSAKSSIIAALHELDNELIAQALIKAKNKGLTVQVVTETDYMDEESIRMIQEAGIAVVNDRARGGLMHNKFLVFDKEYVWTGSFNTTYNGANKNNNNAVYIHSKELAGNYDNEFKEMFSDGKFGGESDTTLIHRIVTMPDGTEIMSLFAPENKVDQVVIEKIYEAESQIRFLVFSFTLDDIGQAMIDKARMKVDVKGVFERRGANSKYSEYPRLLEAGLDVRLDANKYICHHKVIIIDDNIVLTGSFNFSKNATEKNDENLLVINNRRIAKKYLEEFERLFEKAAIADKSEIGKELEKNEDRQSIADKVSTGIDINTASAVELQELPGVGQKIALRIIAGRPYSSVQDLRRVKGIGAKTMQKLEPLIIVRE